MSGRLEDPIVGTRQLAAGAKDIEVRGRSLAARRRFLLAHHGNAVLQEILDRLRPELRELLSELPLAFSWISLADLIEIDRQIIQVAWGGQPSQMRQLHAEMAQQDMSMAYRVLFKLGSPSFILSKVDIAYRHYFRPGGIDLTHLDDSKGVARLRGPALPYYLCAEGIPGWTRAAVELSGGASVASLHPSCRHRGDAECIWEMTWR